MATHSLICIFDFTTPTSDREGANLSGCCDLLNRVKGIIVLWQLKAKEFLAVRCVKLYSMLTMPAPKQVIPSFRCTDYPASGQGAVTAKAGHRSRE